MKLGQNAESGKGTVQSVERALDILEALNENGEMGLVELSQFTGLNVSTVHRLLGTLIERGYARQNPQTSKYSLGLKMLFFGKSLRDKYELRALAKPFLRELVDLSGETANLAIIDRDEAVFIEQVESPKMVKMFTQVGTRVPLYCTGVGKALMAYLRDEEIDHYVRTRNLLAETENTITDAEALKAELHRIRKNGYSVDDQEYEEGVSCIAAPVFDGSGRVVGAISVSGPTGRFDLEQAVTCLAGDLKRVAREFSARLGYVHPLEGR